MSVAILRNSERSTFARCPQKWVWAWREGLVPKRPRFDARWFGGGVHVALAAWYCGPGKKRGPHPAETWEKFARDAIAFLRTSQPTDEQEAQWTDARDLGRIMLEGYVEKYGRDEHKLILKPEQTFSLLIPHPKRPKETLVLFAGTTDASWRDADSGLIILDEHKTAKSISTTHLPIDNQAGSYSAVVERYLREAGLIGDKDRIAAIEYNFLRKGLPDERPSDAQGYATNKPTRADYIEALKDTVASHSVSTLAKMKLQDLEELARGYGIVVLGERSKVQPQPLFVRSRIRRTRAARVSQLRRIQDEALVMSEVKAGNLPVLLNPTRDCPRDCDFFSMCELKENGGNWKEFKRIQFIAQDPYADHRESTED